MTENPAVIHLVYRDGLSPITQSVAATPLSHLHRQGRRVSLLFFKPIGERLRPSLRQRWRKTEAELRRLFPGPIHFLGSPPSRMKWAWDESAQLSGWFRRTTEHDHPMILQCQGPFATQLGIRLRETKPVKVIHYLLGLAYAEHSENTLQLIDDRLPDNADAETRRLFDFEKRMALEADAVISISEAMTRCLSSSFNVPLEKITTIPCCVDYSRFNSGEEHRENIRRDLGLTDRFVLAFCGGIRWWQLPEQGVRIFAALRRLMPSAHYLALVADPQKMRELLRAAAVPDQAATVLRVAHEDMPRYLAAADLGLMTRAPSIASVVSSPIKFAEYLASGLPVIIHPHIGDYSDLVQKEKLGVVIPHEAGEPELTSLLETFLGTYREDMQGWRQRCRTFVCEQLSWAVHLHTLASLHDRLMDLS